MKTLVLMIGIGLAVAPATMGQAGKAKAAEVKAKVATKVELPAGAEKINDGAWRYKDAAGKVWIYTRTPFGYGKALEGAAGSNVPEVAGLRVAGAEGGKVKFERDSPFGKSVWTKTAAEMNEQEKAAYAKWLETRAGGQ